MCEAVTRLAFGTVFNFPLSFRKMEQFNLNFFLIKKMILKILIEMS